MIIKIIAVVMIIIALLLTFRVDWVLRTFFKKEEPTMDDRLKIKYAALGIAVIVFIAVLLVDKL